MQAISLVPLTASPSYYESLLLCRHVCLLGSLDGSQGCQLLISRICVSCRLCFSCLELVVVCGTQVMGQLASVVVAAASFSSCNPAMCDRAAWWLAWRLKQLHSQAPVICS
jgi:hypothetical protein